MFRITTITHLIFLSSSFQVSAFDTIKSFDGLYLESSLRLKPPILKEGHTWKSSKSFWVNRYRSGPKVVSFGKYFSGDYKVHLRLNAAYDYIKSQPTNFKVQFKTYLFRKQQYLQRFAFGTFISLLERPKFAKYFSFEAILRKMWPNSLRDINFTLQPMTWLLSYLYSYAFQQ